MASRKERRPGRPTIRKDGIAMTDAERQARRRKRVGKLINRIRRKQRREAKRNAPRRHAHGSTPPIPDGMEQRIGDAREVLADIADNTVPLILTDPPYGHAAEPLYCWLAAFARRVLIPGGSLICFTGQSTLNRDMAIFDAHLRYWWQFAMLHDTQQRLFGKGVLIGFKPVLWYVKGHRRAMPGRSPLLPDVLRTGGRDKTLHEWGQGDGGIRPLIEHLTDPGELVLDPFAGSATWGRITIGLGRRWLGCDLVEGGAMTVETGFNLAAAD
jgi:hypothetical protein